ncbi:DUF2927 domain-containing protein [Ruegeria arenilitoris]|uniref:ATP-dependent transcriptional regulator n=1 Tax=Ruegeria arenilitoris TaxID=1173585 RepID=A0A238JWY0_9RHOB|nr:DUF2927 domain-containing protein [Ruegeria arenilitoris]SMX35141.1 hypothetical protein RUA8715_00814 [Ruegeria arenilitoris]
MKRLAGIFLGFVLAGCSSVDRIELPDEIKVTEAAAPVTQAFGAPRPFPPARSNTNIAADFVDLHFSLESGTALPVFTRFEGPITVRLTGAPAPTMQSDLTRLLTRLQREARIDIRQVNDGQANITIEAVTQRQIQRLLPQAACFVVPNASSLEEYNRDKRKTKSSWRALRSRERLAIFIPNDVSPQEMRDCLHEELAQAIGPLNDMYRLPDSVFNDDNFHTVLTGFDMLILRATYAPELQTGMTREQVAQVIPGVIARLNPRGANLPVQPISETPREWIDAVQLAVGKGRASPRQMRAIDRAMRIGREQGWTDHRRAYPHYLKARLGEFDAPEEAQREYAIALQYLRATPGTELQRAHISVQTAAYALTQGRGPEALPDLDRAIATMTRAENASMLATLLLLKAEALKQAGKPEQARSVRLDSLGWARYGFGSELVVSSLMQDVALGAP